MSEESLNSEAANEHFPLWKVESEQFVRGRDSGQLWSDPYNDVVLGLSVRYYSRDNVDESWRLEYEDSSSFFEIPKILERLKHINDIWINGLRNNEYCMFEFEHRIFSLDYFMDDQKCVSGRCISGDWFDDGELNDEIKVDFISTHVNFYKRNCIVVRSGGIYLNGEKIMTSDELEGRYGIQYYEAVNCMSKFVELINRLYPISECCESWCGSYILNLEPDIGSRMD